MKDLLRLIFSPILKLFESGIETYAYKPSHRVILIVIGFLFSGLASLVFYYASDNEDAGYFIPVIIFGSVGLVSFIIGLLGTERAVAKIWGSR